MLNAISRKRLIAGGDGDEQHVRRRGPGQHRDQSRPGAAAARRLTPQACIATNSRSADSRPKATSRPSSSDIGIVSAERLRQQRRRSPAATTGMGTPLAMKRLGVLASELGMMKMNVKTSSPMHERHQHLTDHVAVDDSHHGAAGGSSHRHYDARRAALAHASAVLPGPGDGRAHPAVGAAARAEGLLGHGGAAARVPRRAR